MRWLLAALLALLPIVAEARPGGADIYQNRTVVSGGVVALDANATAAATTTSATTVTNNNLTIGSVSNECLVAELAFFNGASTLPTSVTATWNSVSMTQIGTVTVTSGVNRLAYFLFGLVNATSGNHALVASWTGSMSVALNGTSFSGCNQTGGTTTFANEVSNTGSTSPTTVTLTNGANSIGVSVQGALGGLNSSGGNGTQLYFENTNTGSGAQYTTTTNPTMTWTSTATSWGSLAASIVHN